MPVPTAYTEGDFKTWLFGQLGATAEVIGWQAGETRLDDVVIETLFDIGESDVGDVAASQIRALRALGRVRLWQAVSDETAGEHAFSADEASISREQIHEHANAKLEQARADAMPYDPAYAAQVDVVTYHRDPTADYDDDLATAIDEALS